MSQELPPPNPHQKTVIYSIKKKSLIKIVLYQKYKKKIVELWLLIQMLKMMIPIKKWLNSMTYQSMKLPIKIVYKIKLLMSG